MTVLILNIKVIIVAHIDARIFPSSYNDGNKLYIQLQTGGAETCFWLNILFSFYDVRVLSRLEIQVIVNWVTSALSVCICC